MQDENRFKSKLLYFFIDLKLESLYEEQLLKKGKYE
jgi:hypothetical protein